MLQCVVVCCSVLPWELVLCELISHGVRVENRSWYTEYCKILHLLQHTATHCNTLQRTATYCNILQHTATHCNALQHTATHCNALPHTATKTIANCSWCAVPRCGVDWQHTATHYNTLHRTATHCNIVQHTSMHCNVPQQAATHCNTIEKSQRMYCSGRWGSFPTYCNALQRTARHCNALQHITKHCNTLQRTATNIIANRSWYTTPTGGGHLQRQGLKLLKVHILKSPLAIRFAL